MYMPCVNRSKLCPNTYIYLKHVGCCKDLCRCSPHFILTHWNNLDVFTGGKEITYQTSHSRMLVFFSSDSEWHGTKKTISITFNYFDSKGFTCVSERLNYLSRGTRLFLKYQTSTRVVADYSLCCNCYWIKCADNLLLLNPYDLDRWRWWFWMRSWRWWVWWRTWW